MNWQIQCYQYYPEEINKSGSETVSESGKPIDVYDFLYNSDCYDSIAQGKNTTTFLQFRPIRNDKHNFGDDTSAKMHAYDALLKLDDMGFHHRYDHSQVNYKFISIHEVIRQGNPVFILNGDRTAVSVIMDHHFKDSTTLELKRDYNRVIQKLQSFGMEKEFDSNCDDISMITQAMDLWSENCHSSDGKGWETLLYMAENACRFRLMFDNDNNKDKDKDKDNKNAPLKDKIAYFNLRVGRIEQAFDMWCELLNLHYDDAYVKDNRANIEIHRGICPKHMESDLCRYSEHLVKRAGMITERKRKAQVTVTMTTCKRLHLFRKTVNAMLWCFQDELEDIRSWVVIDDNSSESDRGIMQAMYPFIKFIWKTPEQKNHARSMDMLANHPWVDTEYVLHLEDDWIFFERRPYIAEALAILSQKHDAEGDGGAQKKYIYSQVAFNRCDANEPSPHDLAMVGAEPERVRVFYPIEGRERTLEYTRRIYHPLYSDEYNAYFKTKPRGSVGHVDYPHYTLKPSILRRSVWKECGPFYEGEDKGFFEKRFAHRFYDAGHRTAHLNGVYFYHIGTDPQNAYALNNVDQFNGS